MVETFISLEAGLAGEEGFTLLIAWRVCLGVPTSRAGSLDEASASLGNLAAGSPDDSDGRMGSQECFLFFSEAALALAAGLVGAMVKKMEGEKNIWLI